MKNATCFKNNTTLSTTPILRFVLFALFLLFSTGTGILHAQAKLSVQGILKKSSGDAVADGSYNLTFKLYTVETGGSAIWTEVQNDVDVVSGIYSTVLGNGTPLNVAFNQPYYLGVTVGSTEMTPRIQLTSAPYALSIIGNTNQFPSSGTVLADSIKVTGAVLGKAGVPGANGINHNGFAFLANNGHRDSGLFSTPTTGNVSLYVNNSEKLKATADSVVIKPDLRMGKGSNLNYNGLDDWRLVYSDNFQSGSDALGWQVYNPLGNGAPQYSGWNNPTSVGNAPLSGDVTKFIGRYLYPAVENQTLKKFYDLSNAGTYSYIKVKFKYYFIDSWNSPNPNNQIDAGWAAFAESVDGNQFRLGWYQPNYTFQNYNPRMSSTAFQTANKWEGNSINTEQTGNYEMTAYKNGSTNGFWLMFGQSLDDVITDERWGVGMIEIWVK